MNNIQNSNSELSADNGTKPFVVRSFLSILKHLKYFGFGLLFIIICVAIIVVVYLLFKYFLWSCLIALCCLAVYGIYRLGRQMLEGY